MTTTLRSARNFRTILIVVFVLTQLALACHRVDVEHLSGEQCESCVAGASLHFGVVATGVVDGGAHVLVPVLSIGILALVAVRAYRSRAPPRLSAVVS